MSIKLKSQVQTPKGFQIIRRAERAILNERVRLINNTINMLSMQKDTCISKLKEKIGEDLVKECELFIKRREARHCKTMSRQKRKLEALCHKSSSNRCGCSNTIHSSKGDHSYPNTNNNIQSGIQSKTNTESTTTTTSTTRTTNTTSKWVINISDKPLTEEEEKLLAHGPTFVILPKNPPIIQYVAAIEQACTKLEEGKAEEFRVQVKAAIQKIHKPKSNITREERIALTNLKKDPSRMVLTAD